MSDFKTLFDRHGQLVRGLLTNSPRSTSLAPEELRKNREEFSPVLAVVFISLLSYRFEGQPPTHSKIRDHVLELGTAAPLPVAPIKAEALIRSATVDSSLGEELTREEDVPTLKLKLIPRLALTSEEARTDIEALVGLTKDVATTVPTALES